MRGWLGLLLLLVLYVSFAFTQGRLRELIQEGLNWLAQDQGFVGYQLLGWVWLFAIICGYLFYADRRDKRRQQQLLLELKDRIVRHGVLARKQVRNEAGMVLLEAAINYVDNGYVLQVRQLTPTDNQKVILSNNKYIEWQGLVKAIDGNEYFHCQDFLGKPGQM